MASIEESITNALEYLEAHHGHKNGAIYEDLSEALDHLKERHPRTMQFDPALEPGRLLAIVEHKLKPLVLVSETLSRRRQVLGRFTSVSGAQEATSQHVPDGTKFEVRQDHAEGEVIAEWCL